MEMKLLTLILLGCACAHVWAGRNAQFSTVKLPPDALTQVGDTPGFPVGNARLGDVPWQIGGEDGRPRAVEVSRGETAVEVNVGMRGQSLHFLHAFRPGPGVRGWRARTRESVETGSPRPDYPTVFRYGIRYADDTRLTIPVRWGEGVESAARRTFEPVSRFIADMACARVAWEGPLDQKADLRPVAYAMDWSNPYPDKEIVSVEVLGGNEDRDFGTGFLYAVSVGHESRAGRIFYVAPDGDNAHPGTYERPWADLHKAAETLEPGDTVYVRGGVYELHRVVSPYNSGREDAWITYAGYPGETAVLDASDIHCSSPRNEMEIDNGRKVTVAASRSGAFHIFNRSYIRVRNLQIRDAAYEGIAIGGFPWWQRNLPEGLEPSHHIEILYNTTNRTVTTGIGAWGNPGAELRDIRIVGNRVLNAFHPELILSTTDPGWQARTRRNLQRGRPVGEENLDVVCVHGFEVAYNEVSWGGKEGIDCKETGRDGDIHHNYCHDQFVLRGFLGGKVNIYIDSWHGDLNDIDVHHNVCERSGTGIRLMNEGGTPLRNVRVRRNLCVDNYWFGIAVRCNVRSDEWVENIRVLNNTVFRNGYKEGNNSMLGGISIGTSTRRLRNVIIRNNISVENRDYALAYHRDADLFERSCRMDYNLCRPAEMHIRGRGQRLPTFGMLPVLAEPKFVCAEDYNFRLAPESPAIDAGHPDEAYNDQDGTRNDLGAFPFDQTED